MIQRATCQSLGTARQWGPAPRVARREHERLGNRGALPYSSRSCTPVTDAGRSALNASILTEDLCWAVSPLQHIPGNYRYSQDVMRAAACGLQVDGLWYIHECTRVRQLEGRYGL